MNLDIKKRIDLVNNTQMTSCFFDLLKNLITHADITEEDKRLSITLRNDNVRRFSVNINGRLVLAIVNSYELAIMVNKDDYFKISNLDIQQTEDFKKNIPAKLLYLRFHEVERNLEILKELWLRSCLDYLPAQAKSQYRLHHVDELYKIAKDDEMRQKYLDSKPLDYSNFQQIIKDFTEYINNENSVLSNFEIQKLYKSYVWIWDAEMIIGDPRFCHYELITRKGHLNRVSIELHFNPEFNDAIKNLLSDNLDEQFYWNDKHGDELSLALQKTIDFSDPDLLPKLSEGLKLLDDRFGEIIRNYFSDKFPSDNTNYLLIDHYKKWHQREHLRELDGYHALLLFGFLYQLEKNELLSAEQIDSCDVPILKIIKEKIKDFDYDGLNVFESFLDNLIKKYEMKNMTLNQILYGPPGTGKTYNTINKAISIINPSFDLTLDRSLVKKEYDRLVENKQIVFTSFHQSMSYEDFVEGIKPKTKNENVTYSVEDGVFKTLVKKALSEYIIKDNEVSDVDGFDTIYDDFVSSIKPLEGRREGTFQTKTGIDLMLVEANSRSILVKYLWDNNKTKDKEAHHVFTVSKEKLKKVLLEGIDPSKVKSLLAELHPLIGHIHCELFAVYKSFYEFMLANKGEIETIHFDYEDQTFDEVKDQFDLVDKKVVKNKIVKSYVLIIDEINRGNVSQIFGELITLIENSKRLGADENLEVTLPYSKEKFGVPSNVFIIGTMNTADRSVEALDTALRRRFSFVEMLPDLDILSDKSIAEINLKELLMIINKRIEILLDRDHTIGHSYFINVTSVEHLKATFKNNIIPLLQEYFYGDYEKIGMILGNGFFEEPQKFTRTIFADFATQNYPDSGSILNLKVVDDSFDIIKALETLMKKQILVNG